jgi:hypothetical protein
VTAERCPSCNAALAPQAQWCSLCYADLRPVEPGGSPAATPNGREPLPLQPAGAGRHAAVATLPPGRELGWPCLSCGTRVALELTACPECGTGFLAPLHQPALSLRLPVVGDVGELGRGARAALTAAAAAVLSGVLLLGMLVLGALH